MDFDNKVNGMDSTSKWSREELKLAFHLYCQTPFGRLHRLNPEIVELATLLGRTPNALAMKLSNFASLDPAITQSGRKGLSRSSKLDREVWQEFHGQWEQLAVECALHLERLRSAKGMELPVDPQPTVESAEEYAGETRSVMTEARIKQGFFRRTILSSYGFKCCISGVSEPRLLVASHIVPWHRDRQNRLNPRNGLCLSAIHDRAFDAGLIALSNDHCVLLSQKLKASRDEFVHQVFGPLEQKPIVLPDRFHPEEAFLSLHRTEIFVDGG